ncbi:helix-turn-helix domain-containing protein [Amycolatopsis magusensis]|uniref:helix-turn-helix domain-containing protein n=1 Tax=Amycolatopsis magusensis TaxID=882444 RepID=UPI0037B27C67
MPRPTSVLPVTDLGRALERCRTEKGLSRKEAYLAAKTSGNQWNRLLTERRSFDLRLVTRAANAVGLHLQEAFLLAGVAVVPDNTSRTITQSELQTLQAAS